MALYQIAAAARMFQLPDDLVESLSLLPPLEVGAGLVWASLFAWGAVKLARRKGRAVRYIAWLFALFILYSIVRLMIFARTDYDQGRLPFLMSVAALIILVMFLIIRFRRRGTSTREKIPHDRKPED